MVVVKHYILNTSFKIVYPNIKQNATKGIHLKLFITDDTQLFFNK